MKLTVALLVVLAFGALVFGAAEEAITNGDAAYDKGDNEAALSYYTQALKEDPQNCEATWKISRAYSDIGDDKTEKSARNADFTKANEFAQKAIAICPENDNAHLYLSVAIGRVALMSSKKEQVQLSQKIKEEAEKAIELNPDNDIAHHVYGRWHRKIATLSGFVKAFAKVLYGGLPPASLDQAVAHLQKAAELDPASVNHQLELGKTFEIMKDWQKAADAFNNAISLPSSKPKDEKFKAEAKERLQTVSAKL